MLYPVELRDQAYYSGAKMRKRKCITLVKTAYLMTSATFCPQASPKTPFFSTRKTLALSLLSMLWLGVLHASAQCTSTEEPVALFSAMELSEAEWPTQSKDTQVGLQLDDMVFADLRLHKYDALALRLPFLNGKELLLELEAFLPFSENFNIGRTQESGKFVEEKYLPQLLSYRIVSPGMRGTLVIMNDRVMGTLQYKGQQYDLSALRGGADGKHVLFLLADAAQPMEFECGVDEFGPRRDVMPMGLPTNSNSSMLSECVEVAIDIDYYTYGEFGNDCYPAVEWALALLAGVNTIYTNDLEGSINIQASFIHVWETTDPYDGINNDSGTMLDTFRMEWLTNPDLINVQRDLVHLMTRRSNTGTGGIAYLSVVCSAQYAVGFSSYLDPSTTYNLSNYSWNLNVVGHELGHNFGSNHTHWCGWPSGPIDDCYEAEGSCTNEPEGQVGTMMSYCHAVAGGSVNLNFHPTVINSALLPTINSDGSCFNTCVDMTTTCAYYGCTDDAACNFDLEAVQDNGTCAFSYDDCGVCGGDNTICSGCMDETACNYDADATIDDGSCFIPVAGTACDCSLDLSFDVQLSAGETASQSVNGSGYVTGFSVVLDFVDSPSDQSWANEMMVGITTPDGICLQYGGYNLSLDCPSAGNWPADWNTSAAGTYSATAVFSDPISGAGDWTITLLNSWDDSEGALYNTTLTFAGLCEAPDDVFGCTSSNACNYNASATADDGSCDYISCAGCTDSEACNYDETATLDDESCDFTSCVCEGDLNGDDQIAVSDILIFLSDFGCVLAPCPGDIDGDEQTNVNDLLILLALFGEICE